VLRCNCQHRTAFDSVVVSPFWCLVAWPCQCLQQTVHQRAALSPHQGLEVTVSDHTPLAPLVTAILVSCWPLFVLQYKFIVDGDWKHDPNQRAMRDENGNVNNVIEVQEYVPENLENISGFDPPPSPSSR